MDTASRSKSRIEERLTLIEEEFGSLAVTQTTVEVGDDQYQRALEYSRNNRLTVEPVVYNDGGEMLQKSDGELPCGQTKPNEGISAATRRIVREAADINCSVRDVDEATIYGFRNSADPKADTVYRLCVTVTARTGETDLADDACWEQSD
jgi:ADP-ribose pyrophosphatase YjhB (NUDIX family)